MYSITGWSKGARVPISYNLRPGQSRGMGRVNMFPTVINQNNFFGVDYGNYDTCCNNSNSIPKWTQWLMGIGIGTSFIGNILGIFSKDGGGGGSDVEGAGGNEEKKSKKTETTELSKLEQARTSLDSIGLTKSEGYGVLQDEDGKLTYTYTYTTKDGDKKTISAKNVKELLDAINEASEAKPENPPKKIAATSTASETGLPKLFTDMSGLTTTDAVLSKFKEATGADAVKISDLSGKTITLDEVVDKGNGTSVSDSFSINVSDLKDLKPNTQKTLNKKFHGKDVVAENVDGYIRVTVGSQSYIVGKASDGSYKGYQFENGNVTGYNSANWTAPPPRKHT